MPGDQQGVHRQKHKVRRKRKVFFIFSAVTRYYSRRSPSRVAGAIVRRDRSIGPSVARCATPERSTSSRSENTGKQPPKQPPAR